MGQDKPESPLTRAELERALRASNLMIANLRDELLSLAAQVVVLRNELAAQGTIDSSKVEDRVRNVHTQIQLADESGESLSADFGEAAVDKYGLPKLDIPCEELMPLCKARCCKLQFALSTQDLNEGTVRWDYAKPYWIEQRAGDGYCVHNDAETKGCGVYECRPSPCRKFDCREDPRIWADYAKRIPAKETSLDEYTRPDDAKSDRSELMAAIEDRKSARVIEGWAVSQLYGQQSDDISK